jgi:MFS family permease
MTSTGRPYHALRHRDFRWLWVAQLVSLTGSQMQTIAVHWHVYLLTRSPLALGGLGLTRVVPLVVFSLWGGVLADRRDRRRLLVLTQVAMTLIAVVLAALTASSRETLVTLYGLYALLAAATAFDNPARQALVPRLVPARDLAGAVSLNLTAFHAAFIGGPALAGFILAGSGGAARAAAHGGAPVLGAGSTHALVAIYVLNALSFLGVLASLATLRVSGAVDRAAVSRVSPLQSLRDGLRFVFTTPIMVWTTGLDFLATFFAGSLSLLPVFADQVLHAGAAGYGWLMTAPAAGAFVGSLFTATRPLPRAQGRLLLVAIAAYGATTVVYGLSTSFVVTFVALAASGLADLVSTVIRQTLRQLLTPDALRGRMTSVNMVFFMGGPQLGEMEAGLVASLFASAAAGVVFSVVSGGIATLLLAAVAATATPVVRRYRVDEVGMPESG